MILPSDKETKWLVEGTQNIVLCVPRWGTLLQYGRADVMRILFSPSSGNLGNSALPLNEQERTLIKLTPIDRVLAPI